MRKSVAVIAVAILTVFTTSLAWAFWTGIGSGTASASTATLSAPTGLSAKANNANVAVGWSGVTAPDGGGVDGFYVQRLAGAAATAACDSSPGSLLAAGTLSCSDRSVPAGTYTYKVTAVFRSWSATSDASPSVTVAPTAAAQLAFTSTAVSGPASTSATLGPITVQRQDSSGAPVVAPSGGAVLNLTSSSTGGIFAASSGGPALTSMTIPAGASSVDFYYGDSKAGSPTITASSGSIFAGQTATITPASAARLAFTTQPSSTATNSAITPSPVVQVQDSLGNTVTSSGVNITLALTTNPTGATLNGTKTVAAVNGVATFNTLSVSKAGAGYVLSASSSGFATSNSASFNVGDSVSFTPQPTTTVAGATIGNSGVNVTVKNGATNVSGATVTLAIQPGTGTAGATLAGTTTTTTNSSGVATFPVSIALVGSSYNLIAQTGSISSASGNFDITPATATKLAFGTQPSATVAGASISPSPTVRVLDTYGNLVTSSSVSVTMALGSNSAGGTLSGTRTVNASSGVATFSSLSINNAGAYTLSATSGSLAATRSSSFTVTPAPTQLGFATQPSPTAAGSTMTPPPTVQILDGNGNVVTSSSASVTVALSSNPAGGTLSGTKTVTAVNGVATFSGLSINKSGSYTLAATSTGLTGATSNSFTINPGAATRLVATGTISGQASDSPALGPLSIEQQDANGNPVPAGPGGTTVTLSSTSSGGRFAPSPGGTATTTVSITAGLSSTSVYYGDTVVGSPTITATAGGLTSATLAASITPASASQLKFLQQPTSTAVSTSITPPITVQVLDAYGNVVTTSTAGLTLQIANNPGGGTLSGTATQTPSSGVATFNKMSINKKGAGYTLSVTSPGLTSDTSSSFNIT